MIIVQQPHLTSSMPQLSEQSPKDVQHSHICSQSNAKTFTSVTKNPTHNAHSYSYTQANPTKTSSFNRNCTQQSSAKTFAQARSNTASEIEKAAAKASAAAAVAAVRTTSRGRDILQNNHAQSLLKAQERLERFGIPSENAKLCLLNAYSKLSVQW